MTDSVGISLDLTRLPYEARMQIPQRIGMDTDGHGEIVWRGAKPTKQRSPMSGTGTKWIVRYEEVKVNGVLIKVPRQIDADLNIPNAVKGHNLLHGTSVFAAGIAALYLLKIWLAEHGVERKYLEMLTTADVTLRSATLTYLLAVLSVDDAKALMDDLIVTGRILNPRAKLFQSTNDTLVLPYGDVTLKAYNKTYLGYCNFPDGAPVQRLIEANDRQVRVEATLTGTALKKYGLETLESWRTAHADGTYEMLFNETFRKRLQLDLRHNSPRPEVMAKLTPTERACVVHYLAGGEPKAFSSIAASAHPAVAYSKLRKAILQKCSIDIGIPWKDHVRLRCHRLKSQIVYPGDHQPERDLAPWCFCSESWPDLLAELEARLKTSMPDQV